MEFDCSSKIDDIFWLSEESVYMISFTTFIELHIAEMKSSNLAEKLIKYTSSLGELEFVINFTSSFSFHLKRN